MSDISMCQQSGCPKSWECWRYNAPPDKYRQSYISPEFTDNGCNMFWDMGKILNGEQPQEEEA